MVAEETQELGRRGIATIKRWLEATTFLELPFDAYNQRIDCTVKTCTNQMKCFDLTGYYLTGNKDRVYVEGKRYSSAGSQYPEFQKFLAIVYGVAMLEKRDFGAYRSTHFLWVTYHPFKLKSWSKLESPAEMRSAIECHPELAGQDIDQRVLADLSSRIGVFVFNEKQEALSLTSEELQKVRVALDRKANSL
jgi:hypothetical protein